MLFKLSSILSQNHLLDLLRDFFKSDTAKVLVVIVNMQEDKQKEIVNHIRIMTEEEEHKHPYKQKLFVLLLHFPPPKLRNGGYPSLFLKGWNHYYLDTIAHTVATRLDIQTWLRDCCFPHSETVMPCIEDPLLSTLKGIMKEEALPILAARVNCGDVDGGHFNTNMSVPDRTLLLQELLFEKYIGHILCERFCSYWVPNIKSKYLEEAAVIAKTHDSTLSITDSIYTTFKNLFIDFLVYMITQINQDCNIDVLFMQSSSHGVEKLFLGIIRQLPLPQLSELKLRSVYNQFQPKVCGVPQFPFFKMISEEINWLVDISVEEINSNLNFMEESKISEAFSTTIFTGNEHLQNLMESVLKKMNDKMVCLTNILSFISIKGSNIGLVLSEQYPFNWRIWETWSFILYLATDAYCCYKHVIETITWK